MRKQIKYYIIKRIEGSKLMIMEGYQERSIDIVEYVHEKRPFENHV